MKVIWNLPYKVKRCKGVRFKFAESKFDKYLQCGTEEYLEVKGRAIGSIGCWIAHSKALEGVTEREGITVVLEDDFTCKSNFFDEAIKMVNEFNRNFDVILFDMWGEGPLDIHKLSENIYRPKNCSYPYYSGSHCLFVNNEKIPKILELKLNSKILDYDGYLLWHENIETYVFYTGLCKARIMRSNIEN